MSIFIVETWSFYPYFGKQFSREYLSLIGFDRVIYSFRNSVSVSVRMHSQFGYYFTTCYEESKLLLFNIVYYTDHLK